MTGPQVEDGYTRIANELLEAILRAGFSKRELTLVLAILRKTYGFNKKEDDMTFQQLERITGIKRSHVSETVRDLAARKVVLFRDGHHGYVIGINKHYRSWRVSQNGTVNQVSQNGTKPCPKMGQKGVPKREPQKTLSKRQSQKTKGVSQNGTPVEWIDQETWSDFLAHRKAIKKPMSDVAVKRLVKELDRMRAAGNDPNEVLNQSIVNGWQGVFPVKNKTPKTTATPGMIDIDAEYGDA